MRRNVWMIFLSVALTFAVSFSDAPASAGKSGSEEPTVTLNGKTQGVAVTVERECGRFRVMKDGLSSETLENSPRLRTAASGRCGKPQTPWKWT